MATSVPSVAHRRAAPKGMLARIKDRWSGSTAVSRRGSPMARMMRDTPNGLMSSWRPTLRSKQDEVRANYRLAAARTIDSIDNSGWLSGGIDQACTDTAGPHGLQLNAQPDAETLGIDEAARADLSRLIEKRFRRWSNNPLACDARGRSTLGQMTEAMLRYHYAFGEGVALLPKAPRAGISSDMRVLLTSPNHMVLDNNPLERLTQGVITDTVGLPTAYRFRRQRDGITETVDFKSRDANGRPQVVHVFDGMPEQMRGITPLLPVLKVLHQYDNLADATLTAAMLQTVFAATLKSTAFSGDAFMGLQPQQDDGAEIPTELDGYLEARADWWSHSNIDLGKHGQIASLFPGDEFEFHSPKHPGDNYLPFSKNLLREIARCMGITYEAMTGDYEGATYSSVRMATAATWPIILRRRNFVAIPFVQAVYEAWLEEEILNGSITVPGGIEAFRQNRAAFTAAEWQGPAKPTADDFKSARAARERMDGNVTSLTWETAEYGLTPERVFEDKHRENELARKYDLPLPHPPTPEPPDDSGGDDSVGAGAGVAGPDDDDKKAIASLVSRMEICVGDMEARL